MDSEEGWPHLGTQCPAAPGLHSYTHHSAHHVSSAPSHLCHPPHHLAPTRPSLAFAHQPLQCSTRLHCLPEPCSIQLPQLAHSPHPSSSAASPHHLHLVSLHASTRPTMNLSPPLLPVVACCYWSAYRAPCRALPARCHSTHTCSHTSPCPHCPVWPLCSHAELLVELVHSPSAHLHLVCLVSSTCTGSPQPTCT